jgi:hypothetical protein
MGGNERDDLIRRLFVVLTALLEDVTAVAVAVAGKRIAIGRRLPSLPSASAPGASRPALFADATAALAWPDQ